MLVKTFGSAVYGVNAITITVEEELDATAYLNSSPSNKANLEKSLNQDKNNEHILIRHQDL